MQLQNSGSFLRNFVQKLCPGTPGHTDTHTTPSSPRCHQTSRTCQEDAFPARVGIGVFSGKKNTMVIKPQFLMCTLNSTTNESGLCVTTPDNYHPRISGTTSGDIPLALLLLSFPTSPFTISSLRVTIHPRMAIHPFSNPLLFFRPVTVPK